MNKALRRRRPNSNAGILPLICHSSSPRSCIHLLLMMTITGIFIVHRHHLTFANPQHANASETPNAGPASRKQFGSSPLVRMEMRSRSAQEEYMVGKTPIRCEEEWSASCPISKMYRTALKEEELKNL